jgi:hypothetical protein
MINQEMVALSIVGLAAAHLAYRFFYSYLARPFAGWLLKQGQVKLAMALRKQISGASTCSRCSSCS